MSMVPINDEDVEDHAARRLSMALLDDLEQGHAATIKTDDGGTTRCGNFLAVAKWQRAAASVCTLCADNSAGREPEEEVQPRGATRTMVRVRTVRVEVDISNARLRRAPGQEREMQCTQEKSA